MKLRLTRIPKGYGKDGLEIVPKKEHELLPPERGKIHPILKIHGGEIADILDLLDHGFGVELVAWEGADARLVIKQ